MKVEKIGLDKTGFFSESFLAYVAANDKLTPFYNVIPNIDQFEDVIEQRGFPKNKRDKLVEVLKAQYASLSCSESLAQNLNSLLSEKTFTITTGHQLNIFTGPLYFVYKIVTVINAAQQLKEKYPDSHFVPVYWMASEDHDFEEISYFFLYGKKYQWSSEQTGAVGHFDPSELKDILSQLPGDVSIFERAYLENKTLADACRAYVNQLFGAEGLVVIDADDTSLKQELVSVMKSDVLEHVPNVLVTRQSDMLRTIGFKTQVSSREVNFFYLHEHVRSRIERDGNQFRVIDTEWRFSEEELISLIDEHPERFSPNVILRPLYQEIILPNLAYVGGPSELLYWLQLKSMFEYFKVPFPILMPRNFGLVIPQHFQRTWSNTGFSTPEIFTGTKELEKAWLQRNGQKDLTFGDEKKSLVSSYDRLKQKTQAVDPTLVQHIDALLARATGKIDQAQKKLLRAEKRNHKDALGQIHKVKDGLFPNGSLQERRDNFLNFYQENPNFIGELLDAFDPFDYQMHVLMQ